MEYHKFHCLITDQLKIKLKGINEFKGYSFSGRIIYVLSRIDNISSYLKSLEIDEESKVEYLETKKDIHLYMKKTLYRKLKHSHQAFNFYSIAQIIRMIIRIFLDMVDKYGFEKALKRIKKVKKKLKTINSVIGKHNIKVQLYSYLGIKFNDIIKFNIVLIKLLL